MGQPTTLATHPGIPRQLPGRVFLITGGTQGLGYHTALALFRRGAHVVVTGRDEERGARAIRELQQARTESLRAAGEGGAPDELAHNREGRVEFLQLDLANLRQVYTAAQAFINRKLPLHGLINNAAQMVVPFGLTDDGYELQFGVNVIGHYYLTQKLLPILMATAAATTSPSDVRVVSLGSEAMNSPYGGGVGIRLAGNQLNEPTGYDGFWAYGQSKLGVYLMSKILTAQLAELADLKGKENEEGEEVSKKREDETPHTETVNLAEAPAVHPTTTEANPIAPHPARTAIAAAANKVLVNTVHPGFVENGALTLDGKTFGLPFRWFLKAIYPLFSTKVEYGVLNTVYVATADLTRPIQTTTNNTAPQSWRGAYFLPVGKPAHSSAYAWFATNYDHLQEPLRVYLERTVAAKTAEWDDAPIYKGLERISV